MADKNTSAASAPLSVSFEYSEALVELSPRLLAYACSLTRNMALAEDKTQQVLVRLLEKHEQYKITELAQVGFTSVRNALIDEFRRPAHESFDELLNGMGSTSVGSDDLKNSNLFQALFKVGEKCREVLSLLMNGLKQREISEITGYPAGSVASDVSRCRAKLAKELGLC